MTSTSAQPDRLDGFVADTSPRLDAAAVTTAGAAALHAWVSGGSPDFRVEAPALTALATLFDTMRTSGAFVATIRDALLAADHGAVGAAVTIGAARARAALDAAGVGGPPLPLEFAPASLFGLPPTSGFVDDPICAANGNMVHCDHDLALPGVASVLDVRRTYNSLLTRRTGAFGAGMCSLLDVALVAGDDRVIVDLPDGASVSSAGGGRRQLRVDRTEAGWAVSVGDRHRYRFDAGGRLLAWGEGVADVAVTRDGDGRIVQLSEQTTGRSLEIEWADERVRRVTAADGRSVAYTYVGARLTRVTSDAGHLDYEWTDDHLTAVVDPDGVRAFVNEYDATGRVVRQTSPFGRVTEYRYDVGGLTVVTDQAGTRQAMVHDPRGNLTAVIDADGSAMRITYDHADRATRVVDRDGATWRYEYDPASGRLVGRVDPDGLTVRWTWDEWGRLRSSTDRAGHVTTYDYATVGSTDDGVVPATPSRITHPNGGVTSVVVERRLDVPLEVTDPDGVVTRYEYDRSGRPVAVVDAHGARTEYRYDPCGRLAGVVDPLGSVTTLSHECGRLTAYERTGADGRRLDGGAFGYTAAGRIASVATPHERSHVEYGLHGAPSTVTDADGNGVSFEYDAMGNMVRLVTDDGEIFHHFYDEIGRPVGVADPTGATSHLGYDRAGRVVDLVDAEGRTWRRDLDALGRTTRATGPDGASIRYAYHPNGEVAAVTLPDGRTWRSEVDHAGRITGVTAPDGTVAQVTYSLAGRLVERRSPGGRVEAVEYCAAGRPAAVVDATGQRLELERDVCGRLVGVASTDRRGAGHRFERDPAGRVIAHCRFGRTDRFDYDEAGRLVAHVDATGAARRFAYDARGLLAAAVDAAGGTISYAYDSRGRLVTQTTPGGRTTTLDYDAAGYLSAIVHPGGVVDRATRDATGVVVAQSTGGAGWHASLDRAGRPMAFTDHAGRVLAEFCYDRAGRVTSAAVDGWVERFAWSCTDRLDAVTTPDGTTVIERDADGWAVGVTRPDGTHLDIERDPTGRVVAVAGVPARPSARHAAPASDDAAGRLLVGPDGCAYHYDDAGRLARIEHPDRTDTRYEYGPDGLLAAEHTGDLTRRFEHDAAGRLAAVISSSGTVRYRHDDAGRRIDEEHPDGCRVEYRWSGGGRLVGIVLTTADGAVTEVDVTNDAFGRPRSIGGVTIAYDPITGRPCRVGDVSTVDTPGGVVRSDSDVVHVSAAHAPDGVRVGPLTFLGARVHDARTGQFLSPDPMLAQPGAPGSASAYTFAWHDPVNHVDPSGLRPISRAEWDTIRDREEQGALGTAWHAVQDDPWGSLAAVGVVAVGTGLLFTPLAPIGVGVVTGVGLSTAVGLATGSFDPRAVAIGGVAGGVGAGVATATLRGTVLANGLIGGGEEAAGHLARGRLPAVWDVVVAAGASAGTAGITGWVDERTVSGTVRALAGAGAEGSASVAGQVLTGQPIDLRGAGLDAVVGGLEPGAGDWADRLAARRHVEDAISIAGRGDRGAGGGGAPPGSAPEMTEVYRIASIAESLIFEDTGVVLSESVLDAYAGPASLAAATELSVAHHAAAVGDWYGSEQQYAAAEAAFDGALEDVSGTSALIGLTTDAAAARAAADAGDVVLTARVPAETLITHYHDRSVFAVHLLPMDLLSP